MAKIGVLIDTDIFIDALKNVKCARELFRTSKVERFCSILNKKELLSKGGLKDSERKKILDMLGKARVLRIDDDIHRKFFSLTKKYGSKEDLFADYIIAATAWSKKLPLLTRNRKHFEQIEEITLLPAYEGDK